NIKMLRLKLKSLRVREERSNLRKEYKDSGFTEDLDLSLILLANHPKYLFILCMEYFGRIFIALKGSLSGNNGFEVSRLAFL
ncbi:hypothetical protein D5R40_32565, partial [Okeania hirsuta]